MYAYVIFPTLQFLYPVAVELKSLKFNIERFPSTSLTKSGSEDSTPSSTEPDKIFGAIIFTTFSMQGYILYFTW